MRCAASSSFDGHRVTPWLTRASQGYRSVPRYTIVVEIAGEPVQDRVDMSDPPFARLFEEREQMILDEDGVAVSLTVAEKLLDRMRVIVEVPVELPAIVTVVGLALKSKSGR